MMNLLFIGDVVGETGCNFLKNKIYTIKKEHNIDVTIINGENSAQGNGISKNSMDFLFSCGADVITTGNHAFKRKESLQLFDENEFLLRPGNYPKTVLGKGFTIIEIQMVKIAVINLLGTIYLKPLDNPFNVIDEILEEIDTPNIFLDFHAEATAEKKAMGHYLTGKVTAVIGTHTHVQTSDAIVLGNHTGYITDAGMTGPEISVLGVKKEIAIEMFKTQLPVKFEDGDGDYFLNGVVVEFDEKLGKCTKIFPITYR